MTHMGQPDFPVLVTLLKKMYAMGDVSATHEKTTLL